MDLGLAGHRFLVGGGMAYTFLKAQGRMIGASLVEDDFLTSARDVITRGGAKLELPADHVVAKGPDDAASAQVVGVQDIPAGLAGMDIGPATRERFAAALRGAGTVFWNGPMGVFEVPAFAEGTRAVAGAVASSGGVTIVGGGETVQAINQFGLGGKISHISTGGGASLKYLEGKPLAAIAALDHK